MEKRDQNQLRPLWDPFWFGE